MSSLPSAGLLQDLPSPSSSRGLGEGFPPLTWLGKSCDVLKVSVRLLFSRFGYKNLLVSNRDMYYGLGFTVRIMFRLAMKALSVLAEEKTLAALAKNCFQPLWSLFLLWTTLSACTDRSPQYFPGTAEVWGCATGLDEMYQMGRRWGMASPPDRLSLDIMAGGC